MPDRKRCCCNCRRNIRTGNPGDVTCHCEIDGHYISYVACFEKWCRRWARETKWDNEKSERVLELYGKLKPYADAEEQGRLVILPCKVGDKVFRVVPKCSASYLQCPFNGGYGIDRCNNCDAFIQEESFVLSMFEYIGKTIFLTREEAESAMKGGQGDA